jgi:hypothetical protein
MVALPVRLLFPRSLRWAESCIATSELRDDISMTSSSEVIREALREWKARRAARSDAIHEIRRLWVEGTKSRPSKDLSVSADQEAWPAQADRK